MPNPALAKHANRELATLEVALVRDIALKQLCAEKAFSVIFAFRCEEKLQIVILRREAMPPAIDECYAYLTRQGRQIDAYALVYCEWTQTGGRFVYRAEEGRNNVARQFVQPFSRTPHGEQVHIRFSDVIAPVEQVPGWLIDGFEMAVHLPSGLVH